MVCTLLLMHVNYLRKDHNMKLYNITVRAKLKDWTISTYKVERSCLEIDLADEAFDVFEYLAPFDAVYAGFNYTLGYR